MHVHDELLQGTVQHGAAPRHRLVALEEHADRNHANKAAADLLLTPTLGGGGHIHGRRKNQVIQAGRGVGNTQQTRDGEAVHIRVNNAHRKPARSERRGKIRGHGGLTHATLTGHHTEHAGQRTGGGERVGTLRLEHRTQGRTLLRVHRTHLQLHTLNALNGGGGVTNLLLDSVLQRATLNGEQNLHLSPVAAGNRLTALIQFRMHERSLNHAQLRNGAAQFGVLDAGKCRVERILQG